MEKVMAEILGIDVDQISVKATTTEKLGFEGQEEGIAVNAVALLKQL
jgi:2-C-methyl-D-erythritol 2,4-cyclodiphosphate synthase